MSRHLFDGSALVRRFNIRDGEVTYQCQFVKTESFKVRDTKYQEKLLHK